MKTAIATTPPPDPGKFQPKDTLLYLPVGSVPVVWLSKKDQAAYRKWKARA